MTGVTVAAIIMDFFFSGGKDREAMIWQKGVDVVGNLGGIRLGRLIQSGVSGNTFLAFLSRYGCFWLLGHYWNENLAITS